MTTHKITEHTLILGRTKEVHNPAIRHLQGTQDQVRAGK